MASSPPAPKRIKYQYTYTALDSLPRVGRVNLYGVVKFNQPVRSTRTGNYYLTVSLYNESLYKSGTKLVVSMFAPFAANLPQCGPGDILRLHRMQIEIFNNKINGKMQLHHGGSWVLFDGWSDNNYDMIGSSSTDPTWDSAEEAYIRELREWLKRDNPTDDPGINVLPSSVSSAATLPTATLTAASSPKRRLAQITDDIMLQSIVLDSYFSLKCQLLQVSTLKNNPDKMAVLLVWDGTKCRLKLNRPDLSTDFEARTHECGIAEQLRQYCVYLVVYGDHVHRAKQMRLGGLYRFSGVHCVSYPSVGKPELYLHERYRILGVTLSDEDKSSLIESLDTAVEGISEAHIDINNRTEAELNRELEEVISLACQQQTNSQINPRVAAHTQHADKINTSPTSKSADKINTSPTSKSADKINTSPTSKSADKINTSPTSKSADKINTSPTSKSADKINTSPTSKSADKINTSPTSKSANNNLQAHNPSIIVNDGGSLQDLTHLQTGERSPVIPILDEVVIVPRTSSSVLYPPVHSDNQTNVQRNKERQSPTLTSPRCLTGQPGIRSVLNSARSTTQTGGQSATQIPDNPARNMRQTPNQRPTTSRNAIESCTAENGDGIHRLSPNTLYSLTRRLGLDDSVSDVDNTDVSDTDYMSTSDVTITPSGYVVMSEPEHILERFPNTASIPIVRLSTDAGLIDRRRSQLLMDTVRKYLPQADQLKLQHSISGQSSPGDMLTMPFSLLIQKLTAREKALLG